MIPAESSLLDFLQNPLRIHQLTGRNQMHRAREGRSIMDVVADDTRSLKRRVGAGTEIDLMRISQVFEILKKDWRQEAWVHKPKPSVKASKPLDIANPNDFVARQRLMSDMIRLALSTDSSRYVVCHFGSGSGVAR